MDARKSSRTSSTTGVQSGPPNRSLTAAAASSTAGDSPRTRESPPARGSSSASSAMRPCRSGARSSRAEASKPRTAFFDGSTRSTRRTRISGRRARTPRAAAARPRRRRGRRTRRRPRRSGSRASGVLARPRSASALHERRPPPLGVEADAVARQQPSWIAREISREARSTRQADPRDVDEVGDPRGGSPRARRGHR